MTVETRISLARPEIGERERELVEQVLESGRLSLGPMLERFEEEFARFVASEEAIAVSSGTAGLHLAVRAVGWSRGQRVVTSPFSFVASANCLLYEGVDPIFCDIDPVTLNITPAAAEAVADERTAGVLPVDMFGYPADLPGFEALAKRRGWELVEDACEALGGFHADGLPIGGRAGFAAFGFYANKQLATGEGGMLSGGTAAQREIVRSERNQGRAPQMDWVDHVRLGFNYRLSDVAAALGVAQLERLAERLAQRAGVARSYLERLSGIEGLELPCPDSGGARRSWFVFVVQIPPERDRDRVIAALADDGIAAKQYFPCIHLQPYFHERYGYRGGEFPIAEQVAERSLALPFFPALEEGQIERVCRSLRSAIGR